jgi:hypothetical protein
MIEAGELKRAELTPVSTQPGRSFMNFQIAPLGSEFRLCACFADQDTDVSSKSGAIDCAPANETYEQIQRNKMLPIKFWAIRSGVAGDRRDRVGAPAHSRGLDRHPATTRIGRVLKAIFALCEPRGTS